MSDLQISDPQMEETSEDRMRKLARERVQKRRNLQGTFVAYVVVNAFFIGVWYVTGHGYFWPGWVLGGWGIGLVLGFWDYMRRPITDADIEEEMRRLS